VLTALASVVPTSRFLDLLALPSRAVAAAAADDDEDVSTRQSVERGRGKVCSALLGSGSPPPPRSIHRNARTFARTPRPTAAVTRAYKQ